MWSLVFMLLTTIPVGLLPSANESSIYLLSPLIQSLHPILSKVLGFLLVVFTGFYINLVSNKFRLLQKENQYVGVLAVLLITFSGDLSLNNSLILCAPFYVRFIDRCFTIQLSSKPNQIVFDAAFSLGIISLIYWPNIFLVVLIWGALLYSPRTNIKSYLISIVTPVLVMYLVAGSLYVFEYSISMPKSSVLLGNEASITSAEWGVFGVLFLGGMLFMSSLFKSISINKTSIKNHMFLLIIGMIVYLIIGLLLNANPVYVFAWLFIPWSIFLANFFLQASKKWMVATYFILLLVSNIFYSLNVILPS
jgi:hypothetical protein